MIIQIAPSDVLPVLNSGTDVYYINGKKAPYNMTYMQYKQVVAAIADIDGVYFYLSEDVTPSEPSEPSEPTEPTEPTEPAESEVL